MTDIRLPPAGGKAPLARDVLAPAHRMAAAAGYGDDVALFIIVRARFSEAMPEGTA